MVVNSTKIITNEKWKIFLGADKLTKKRSVFDIKVYSTYYIFAILNIKENFTYYIFAILNIKENFTYYLFAILDIKENITYYIFAQPVRFDGRQASQGPTYA